MKNDLKEFSHLKQLHSIGEDGIDSRELLEEHDSHGDEERLQIVTGAE